MLSHAQDPIETILIILSASIVLISPIYMYLRKRMIKSGAANYGYSTVHIVKLTLTNLTLIFGVSFIFLLLFAFSVFSIDEWSYSLLMLSVLFLGILGLTFYGSGIYLTSVVLENYTLPQIRKLSQYKTQFLATHLFHGPISHVFIYSGYMIALFILSIISLLYNGTPSQNPGTILALSVLVGLVYALSQIFNGSLPYQFFTSFITLLVFSAMVSRQQLVMNAPLVIYFLGFNFSFIIASMTYFLFLQSKGETIDWDKSGYIHPDSKKY